MQKQTRAPQKTTVIDVLLFDQFSNHCLANCIEPLRAANTLSGSKLYDWRFFTVNGKPVTSSSGLSILPTHTIGLAVPGEWFYVIASYNYLDHDTPFTAGLLVRAARTAAKVFGFDTGPWLMASAGLLDGCPATIHRDELAAFSEKFLHVRPQPSRYCRNANRVTCSGAMASFDLTLDMIAENNGNELRLDVASLLMHDSAISHESRLTASNELVQKAVAVMRDNLETPLSLTAIARRIGVHEKRLQRAFLADLCAPPGTVYRHVRLSMARHLLTGSSHSLAEIAVRTGYENSSSLSRAFKRRFGIAPLRFRLRKDHSAA